MKEIRDSINTLERALTEAYTGKTYTDEEWENSVKSAKIADEKRSKKIRELELLIGEQFKIGNRTFIVSGVIIDDFGDSFNSEDVSYEFYETNITTKGLVK